MNTMSKTSSIKESAQTSQAHETGNADGNKGRTGEQDSAKSHTREDGAHLNPSFIDTFASVEDLLRFQSTRARALVDVFKAEYKLARKSLLASFLFATFVAILCFSTWVLLNVSAIYAATQAGVNIGLALACTSFANLVLLFLAYRQLQQHIDKVGFSRSLRLLFAK